MKLKQIGIWSIVIAALIGGSLLLINMVNSTPVPSTTIEIKNLPPVSKEDIAKGPEKTKVTLIEYADFQCPACAASFPIVKLLTTDFSKDLKIVYRFFPLVTIHKNAMLASQASYAAHKQNKFWEMHDMLYENQTAWADKENAKDIFLDYAKKLNLDMAKFETDLESDSTKQFVENQRQSAFSIGANSTPTFIMNGIRIPNPGGYETFKKIIQDEINK